MTSFINGPSSYYEALAQAEAGMMVVVVPCIDEDGDEALRICGWELSEEGRTVNPAVLACRMALHATGDEPL